MTCFCGGAIMNTYKVVAKCGHVGKGHYVDKIFAIKAESAKDAAERVRMLPRVKHHHKYSIRSVEKISSQEFSEILERNESDPFFFCKNIQEQRAYCNDIIMDEPEVLSLEKDISRKQVFVGKMLLRNPKKYMTVNQIYKRERYAI